ncbi:MAG: hypothetical protein RIT81_04265 [Deltaproteobacteria bacterium]
MARPKQSGTKRQRERTKLEQKKDRERRKEQRKQESEERRASIEDGVDPDLVGIVAGPNQPDPWADDRDQDDDAENDDEETS